MRGGTGGRWARWAGTIVVVVLGAAVIELAPAIPAIRSLGSDPHIGWLLSWAKHAVSPHLAEVLVAALLLGIAYVLRSHSRSAQLLRRDALGLMALALAYCATPGLVILGQIATGSRPRADSPTFGLVPYHGLLWFLPGVAVLAWASAVVTSREVV